MKNVIVIALFLLLSSCSTSPYAKNKISKGESKEVIDKWLQLWKTYDLNMLDDIFLNSNALTYFSSEREGLIEGFEELVPHHIGFGFERGGKKAEKSLWLEKIEIRTYQGSTMVGAVWYFGNKTLPKDSISKGPVTFVLTKDKNGLAKIAHTHFANY